MSSDMPRFALSSLTFADPPGRCRLHSRGFAVFSRLAAVLVVSSLFPWLRTESITAASVHVTLAIALAWLLCFRSKTVVASDDGLLLGSGKRVRLIPWSRVIDIRELPWIRFNPPWYPKMWQVDLDHDQRFDFCGVRKAREIVIEFIERSEAREGRESLRL